MTLEACYIVSDIEPDIHGTRFDIEYQVDLRYRIQILDIEYQTDLRYRIRYRHTISKYVYPISKILYFDIGYTTIDIRYRMFDTYDIEGGNLRYRIPAISIYDIEVRLFDIEYSVFRYRVHCN